MHEFQMDKRVLGRKSVRSILRHLDALNSPRGAFIFIIIILARRTRCSLYWPAPRPVEDGTPPDHGLANKACQCSKAGHGPRLVALHQRPSACLRSFRCPTMRPWKADSTTSCRRSSQLYSSAFSWRACATAPTYSSLLSNLSYSVAFFSCSRFSSCAHSRIWSVTTCVGGGREGVVGV